MSNKILECGDCTHAEDGKSIIPMDVCMARWPYCRHRHEENLQRYRDAVSYDCGF